jgi:Domain of unknown function (DUF4203)
MKRFITLAVAVLLGLVSGQDIKDNTNTNTPTLQSDFVTRSSNLELSWDQASMAINAYSCKIYDSLTLFDLQPIRGPYAIELDIDGDANGNKELLEVHFCNPVKQTKDDKSKRSLVFVRDQTTVDDNAKRSLRLTSGDNSFSSSSILYGGNDEVQGIELSVGQPSDNDKVALCKENTPWSVTFTVNCDASQTGVLDVSKFSVVKNADKCTLKFSATHKAGCGAVKASGFVQYLNSNPWIIALTTIAFGIACCFFGGKIFDWFQIGLPALFAFLFVAVMVSSFGLFSVLEEDVETSGKGVFLAIIGFIIALAAGVAAGLIAKLTEHIVSGIIGGIAGFFVGFLLYSLIFAQFVKSTTALLWITLIITTGLGAWAMYKYDEEAEVHVTHVVGSYLIIRGLAFFLGGYPDEAQTFFQLKKGDFNLPASFYGYLVLFVALNVAGGWFQHHMGYHLETPAKVKKGLNGGNYTNAKKVNGHDNEHH